MVVQTSDDTNISNNNNAPSELIFYREKIEALCGAAIWGRYLIIFFKRLKVVHFQNHPFFHQLDQNMVKDLKGLSNGNLGILLPKLLWPTVRRNCSSDQDMILKFEAEMLKFWDH